MTEQTTVRPFTLAAYQTYLNEGRLMGSRNRATGEVFAPPRPLDPATHGADMEWVELSGRVKVSAFTEFYIGRHRPAGGGAAHQRPERRRGRRAAGHRLDRPAAAGGLHRAGRGGEAAGVFGV